MKNTLLLLTLVSGIIQAAELTAQEAEQELLNKPSIRSEEFERLLTIDGVNPDATVDNGMTLLMQQITFMDMFQFTEGRKETYERNIRLLFKKGASVMLQSFNGYTALMHAALSGNDSVTEILLEKAESEGVLEILLAATEANGKTASQIAHDSGYDELAQKLTPATLKSAAKE